MPEKLRSPRSRDRGRSKGGQRSHPSRIPFRGKVSTSEGPSAEVAGKRAGSAVSRSLLHTTEQQACGCNHSPCAAPRPVRRQTDGPLSPGLRASTHVLCPSRYLPRSADDG